MSSAKYGAIRVATLEETKHGRRNLGSHGQSRTISSGGTALNVKCRTTFQVHETFSHRVDSYIYFKQIEFFSLPAEAFRGCIIC